MRTYICGGGGINKATLKSSFNWFDLDVPTLNIKKDELCRP